MTRLQVNLDAAARATAEQVRREWLAARGHEERDRIRSYVVVFFGGFAVGLGIGALIALASMS